jgi:hypothetical protein
MVATRANRSERQETPDRSQNNEKSVGLQKNHQRAIELYFNDGLTETVDYEQNLFKILHQWERRCIFGHDTRSSLHSIENEFANFRSLPMSLF